MCVFWSHQCRHRGREHCEISSTVQIPPATAETMSGTSKGPGIFILTSFIVLRTTFLLEDRHVRLRQATESVYIRKMRSTGSEKVGKTVYLFSSLANA